MGHSAHDITTLRTNTWTTPIKTPTMAKTASTERPQLIKGPKHPQYRQQCLEQLQSRTAMTSQRSKTPTRAAAATPFKTTTMAKIATTQNCHNLPKAQNTHKGHKGHNSHTHHNSYRKTQHGHPPRDPKQPHPSQCSITATTSTTSTLRNVPVTFMTHLLVLKTTLTKVAFATEASWIRSLLKTFLGGRQFIITCTVF